jgi:hypothetical protein
MRVVCHVAFEYVGEVVNDWVHKGGGFPASPSASTLFIVSCVKVLRDPETEEGIWMAGLDSGSARPYVPLCPRIVLGLF